MVHTTATKVTLRQKDRTQKSKLLLLIQKIKTPVRQKSENAIRYFLNDQRFDFTTAEPKIRTVTG